MLLIQYHYTNPTLNINEPLTVFTDIISTEDKSLHTNRQGGNAINNQCEAVKKTNHLISVQSPYFIAPAAESLTLLTMCWWFLPVVTLFILTAGLAADQPSWAGWTLLHGGMCFSLSTSAAWSDLESVSSEFSLWVEFYCTHHTNAARIGNMFSKELLSS